MDRSKSHRRLRYRKVNELWQEGQILELQGLSPDEISDVLGLGPNNWSRLKRLVRTSYGEPPYGTNLQVQEAARSIIQLFDSGEYSYFKAFSMLRKAIYEHMPDEKKKNRLGGPNLEKIVTLHNRAVLTLEGSVYALTKLPDWPEGSSAEALEECVDRLVKVRRVLEQKINSLRRTTNNA